MSTGVIHSSATFTLPQDSFDTASTSIQSVSSNEGDDPNLFPKRQLNDGMMTRAPFWNVVNIPPAVVSTASTLTVSKVSTVLISSPDASGQFRSNIHSGNMLFRHSASFSSFYASTPEDRSVTPGRSLAPTTYCGPASPQIGAVTEGTVTCVAMHNNLNCRPTVVKNKGQVKDPEFNTLDSKLFNKRSPDSIRQSTDIRNYSGPNDYCPKDFVPKDSDPKDYGYCPKDYDQDELVRFQFLLNCIFSIIVVEMLFEGLNI